MENFNLEEESLMKQYDSKLMRRLLRFAKPYKLHILGVIVIMFIVTCLDLLRPYIIKSTIDNDINPGKSSYIITEKAINNSIKIKDGFYVVNSNSLEGKRASLIYNDKKVYVIDGEVKENTSYTMDGEKLIQGENIYSAYKISKEEVKILRSNSLSSVSRKAIYILVISILIFILNYIQIFILQYTGQKIVYNIRDTVFRHVEGLSLSFFDKNPVGRLVTRVTNDVETLNEMYTSVLVYLFKDFFLITGIIIAMFLLDVKLALITIITLPLIILVSYIFKKYDREA